MVIVPGPRRPSRLRPRAGYSLVELIVSMTILAAMSAASVSLLRAMVTNMSKEGGRLDAQQNGQFGLMTLEREVRMAGAGVVNVQPVLVAASATSIVFNANLVSPTAGDVGAVNDDPDADTSAVIVLRKEQRFLLPGTSFNYPDSTYMQSPGVESGAETISYWLSQDSSSGHANEYVLFRRANNTAPQVVSRGIVMNANDTIFQYFKADTLGNTSPVSIAQLPLIHKAALHGSAADTGIYAVIDSIRFIKVQFTTVFHDPRNGDVTRKMAATIRILNAGLVKETVCGDPPLGVAPTVTTSAAADSIPWVKLAWNASLDDVSGQKDVKSYSLYRRLPVDSIFTDAFLTMPAGSASYTYTDFNVKHGDQWQYGIAALDCTPTASPMGVTGTVTVP